MEQLFALKVDDRDNVATVFRNGTVEGTCIPVRDKAGREDAVFVHEAIPYGHKVALCAIRKGEPVIKYGESIGAASADIARGDYVHVHNMEAMRGRGDL